MSTIKNKLSFLCITPLLMYPALTQCEEKHVSLVVLIVTTRGAQTTQNSQSQFKRSKNQNKDPRRDDFIGPLSVIAIISKKKCLL